MLWQSELGGRGSQRLALGGDRGVNDDGYREILGICEGAKEDKKGWGAFLKDLKERGPEGRRVHRLACLGLIESVAEFYPEAQWQRCIVHWYRDTFSHVPTSKIREVSLRLRHIAGTKWSMKRYMNMNLLRQQRMTA